jgi:branched-subunit amino acid aminotransferase/4-amino-4-deoxychorismate lyase
MPRQFPIVETKLTPQAVIDADECFITSTTREIVPVTEVDLKKISNGTPGPITIKILQEYRARITEELKAIPSI